MALKAGYKGIKKCGPGLKYDNVNGILSLEGESSLKLDNLEDVSITTPLQGDVLMYDGENWENVQPDSDPTEDSANLVTSGGVYAALDDINELIPSGASTDNKLATASDVASRVDWSSYAVTGAVNYLPNEVTNTTKNNITVTVDNNKVVTLDTGGNTASAATSFELFRAKGSELQHWNGKYFSGCINGSDSTYLMRIGYKESPWTALVINKNGVTEISGIPNTNDTIAVAIYVYNGASLSNVKFSPMISDSPNAVYAPHAMTNGELTDLNTLKTLAMTKGTNINNADNIFVYQIGKQVYVSGFYNTTADMASKEVAFSGLPTPKATGDMTRPLCYVGGNMKLGTVEGTNFYIRDSVANGTTVVFCFSYIAA